MHRQKLSDIAVCVVFCSFLAGLGILHVVFPDRTFSEIENRYLAQIPKFSLTRLEKGLYTSDIDTYLEDQFPFRDGFVSLKTEYEYLTGKKEFNGVYLCGDTLISKVVGDDKSSENLNYVSKFQSRCEIPVYFGLIPTAAEIWKDKLPFGAPSFDQFEYIQNSEEITENNVDVHTYLYSNSRQPIYYRTDHHWTSLGAYYGYCAFMDALGLPKSVSVSSNQGKTVTSDFNGTLFSLSGVHWLEPDCIETYIEDKEIEVVSYTGKETLTHGLYADEKLEGKDKYSYFLGGNNPLVIIKNQNASSNKKLLLVRDSFSDSMAPFLCQDFSQVHLLDLRYYRESVTEYAQENNIDCIYICYSVDNFQKDANIALLR